MDAYEATRVVFSRIQALDPENAAKIMGLLLIQEHGDKEMIRLAFGPDSLLHSLVLKARKDLGLLPPASPSTAAAAPFLHRLLGGMPPTSPSSWAPPPAFSRTNSSSRMNGAAVDELRNTCELISPGNPAPNSPFYGGDLADDLQLSFLKDPAKIGPKGGDLFYPDVAGECRSPNDNGNGMPYSYWGANEPHRRSGSPADLGLGSEASGFGWRPCLYFARGFCKNGSSCRFLHGVPDESTVAAATVAGGKMDAAVEQQCQELLLRSRSQRFGAASQLMASAFAYSPTGSMPHSPSSPSTKCMNFLLQHQQQNDTHRAAAALMLGGDEARSFIGRSRMERSDLAGMVNPGSRQIYLTFPADSTFREEDVSNYFSIYGPVQDVRIPYQPKRMFGFVTFVYPETVKLILAKGNPHFVCDARVLVKPYKEKGKVPDKYRKQQQVERVDFSGCTTPTALDSRDPYDLQQLGARMLYSGGSQEMLLRRKLEEQQHAVELQQAIELQGRRFAGLQLLDFNARSLPLPTAAARIKSSSVVSSPELSLSPEDKSPSPVAAASDAAPAETALSLSQAAERLLSNSSSHGLLHQALVNGAADKEESAGEASPHEDRIGFPESADHNLPDSPFASPTRASFGASETFSEADMAAGSPHANNISNSNHHLMSSASALLPGPPTLDMASFKSCFFQMPRFSSGHGAVGL